MEKIKMNKKIVLLSIFATLIMLSMPVISSINAQPTVSKLEKNNECSICPSKEGSHLCDGLEDMVSDIDIAYDWVIDQLDDEFYDDHPIMRSIAKGTYSVFYKYVLFTLWVFTYNACKSFWNERLGLPPPS
jgi:hypothetical protein